MIRCFVTDLDGTLLSHEKKVEERDRQMLLAAREAGVEIGLASGRMDRELLHVVDQLDFPCHRVSQNGACVYDMKGRLLLREQFDPQLARELFVLTDPYDFGGFLCIGEDLYVPRKTPQTEAVERRMFSPFIVEKGLFERISPDFSPSKFSFFGELDRLLKMKREVEDRYADVVDTYVSDRDCVDLMPRGVSKGKGVEALIHHNGWTWDQVVCIGDSYNDIPMLERTPHSFAMAHSDPEVKRHAAYVVEHVAEALEWVLAYNQKKTDWVTS